MKTLKPLKKITQSKTPKGHLGSITELMERYEAVRATGKMGDDDNERARESIEQEVYEYPLEVSVRSGWVSASEWSNQPDAPLEPAEYKILLTTGGPALRIIGRLTEHGQPESARLEWQDWGTPWTEHRISGDDEDILTKFASVFYWGE